MVPSFKAGIGSVTNQFRTFSLLKSSILKRISSRVSTVIREEDWGAPCKLFNEPYAVSAIESPILRHAWLNL